MFSPIAGLVALTLFVFDPTILTNAPFVTTDTGAAFGFFASCYTFYRYIKQRTWLRLAVCGVAIGIALGSKHSAVLLLPILSILAVGEMVGQWRLQRRFPAHFAVRLIGGMVAITCIALFVLWSIYSFRFAMHPAGVAIPSVAEQMKSLSLVMQRVIQLCLHLHLLPESYLYGLVDVQRVGEFMPSYIFGKIYASGQWYYFPVLLSLKWSVGVLALLALAIYAFASGRVHKLREVWFLALPACFYLAVAMASPLNIGVRHVLPVYAFVFTLIGGGVAWLMQQRRVWIYPIAALLLWHVVDSVRMFPNYMPYANVLWGGPAKTHLYFSDSATDWGQQLKWTKQWTDAHNIKECWFAYFPAPFLLPSDYGIPCRLLPTLDTMYEQDIEVPPVVHGPVLISFADLNGFEFGTKERNPYQTLLERQPDDVIANGIAVFNGDFHLPRAAALMYVMQADRLRKQKPDDSLVAAQQAVSIDPEGFDANVALADTLFKLNRRQEAAMYYRKALARVDLMEPSVQQKRRPEIEKKLKRCL